MFGGFKTYRGAGGALLHFPGLRNTSDRAFSFCLIPLHPNRTHFMQKYLLLDPSIASAQHAARGGLGTSHVATALAPRPLPLRCETYGPHTAQARHSSPRHPLPPFVPVHSPLPPQVNRMIHASCWSGVRHGRCLRHRSARRAGARSAAHAACCAAGYRCTSRCRLPSLVARRQQLRCNAHPWLRRAGRRAARRAPARPQGSCEQRARPREGAAAAGWRLRFEFAPVGEGPDGRRGRLGRARVRKRRCAGTVVAPARPTAAKVRRAHAAIARVPRHRLAAARVAPVCSKREKEITTAPLIAARGHALDARCGLECCHHDARWRKRGRGGRAVCAIGVRPGGPIACICRRTGHEVEELCSLARFDASDHRPETWGGRAVGRVLRYRWVQSRWRQATLDSSRYVDQRLGLH